jgi:hypothetical protein
MNKRTAVLAAALLAVLMVLVSGVALSSDMPGESPEALWTYITVTSPYMGWAQWPEHKGLKPGRSPHGPLNAVYVNGPMLESKRTPAKYGSIIVKAGYSQNKRLRAITVMYKLEGYNPTAGDWFFAKYSPDGKPGPYGKPKGCVGCHSAKADNDYIFIHHLK